MTPHFVMLNLSQDPFLLFDQLCGWSRYSGIDVPHEDLQQQLHQARQYLHDVLKNKQGRVQQFRITPRPVRERV